MDLNQSQLAAVLAATRQVPDNRRDHFFKNVADYLRPIPEPRDAALTKQLSLQRSVATWTLACRQNFSIIIPDLHGNAAIGFAAAEGL